MPNRTQVGTGVTRYLLGAIFLLVGTFWREFHVLKAVVFRFRHHQIIAEQRKWYRRSLQASHRLCTVETECPVVSQRCRLMSWLVYSKDVGKHRNKLDHKASKSE